MSTPDDEKPGNGDKIDELAKPPKRLGEAEGLGEKVDVVKKGAARGVDHVLKIRTPVSTEKERGRVQKVIADAQAVLGTPDATREQIEQLQARLRKAHGKLRDAFATGIATAEKERTTFGNVDKATLEDLDAANKLLGAVPTTLKLLRDKSARPPSPPQLSTPEQTAAAEAIKKMQNALEKVKQEHAQKHADLDPGRTKLEKTMSDQGNEEGLNDFQGQDEQGFPPEHRKEMSPSMDERKTGKEAREKNQPPLYTITPPLLGHYREYVADRFDANTLKWIEENYEDHYPSVRVPHEHRVSGKIRGKMALPLPAGYLIDPSSFAAASQITVSYDPEHGTTYLESSVPQEFSVAFGKVAAKAGNPNQAPAVYHSEDIIKGTLSPETNAMLSGLSSVRSSDRALRIAEYVQQTLEYSNESAYNLIYKSEPAKYFEKIEHHKKADCDVANTYFVALCRRAGVPARLVLGHRVDGAKDGAAQITAGTGHAWAEIWDGRCWQTIDATPSGEAQDEEGGEQLDTGFKNEGTDLKPTQKPKPPHPHKRLEDMETKLEDAERQNGRKAPTQAQMDTLRRQQKRAIDTLDEELKKNMEDNIKLLEEAANILEKKGEQEKAEKMGRRARNIQRQLEELNQNAGDPTRYEGLKDALQQANKEAHEGLFRWLYRTVIAPIREKIGKYIK